MSVLWVIRNLLGYLSVACVAFTVGTFALPIVECVGDRWRRCRPAKWRYRDVCGKRCRMPGSRA